MSETKQKSKDLVNYSKFLMLVIMVAVVNVLLPNYIWKKLQEKCWYYFIRFLLKSQSRGQLYILKFQVL